MKKNILALVALVVIGFIVACSAAQKQAAQSLGLDTGVCAAQCATKAAILGKSATTALAECASECGQELLTDPAKRQNLLSIFAGAQAGVVEAGAIVDAGADR